MKRMTMKARKLLDKEEFDYDHFTRLKSTGIEPDYNNIAQFAEKYHQEQLKLLNIHDVSNCDNCDKEKETINLCDECLTSHVSMGN